MAVARVLMLGGEDKADMLSLSLASLLHDGGWRVIRCEDSANLLRCVEVAKETVGKCLVLATFEPDGEVGAWAFDMVWQLADELPESFDGSVSAGRLFALRTANPVDVAGVLDMARWE